MLSEQDHRAHHFGGFLGLALHKIRSKSTDQLKDEQKEHSKPRKRALSSRDLSSVSSTSFEYTQEEQPSITNDSGVTTTIAVFVEPELHSKCSRASSFLKCGLSTPKKQPASAASMSVRVSSPSSSITSDADMLDQTLLNIKMKLVSIITAVMYYLPRL